MNGLFSSSLKKFNGINEQTNLDDLEAVRESVNLDKFFEDVENVKEDMKVVEDLYRKNCKRAMKREKDEYVNFRKVEGREYQKSSRKWMLCHNSCPCPHHCDLSSSLVNISAPLAKEKLNSEMCFMICLEQTSHSA